MKPTNHTVHQALIHQKRGLEEAQRITNEVRNTALLLVFVWALVATVLVLVKLHEIDRLDAEILRLQKTNFPNIIFPTPQKKTKNQHIEL